MEKIELRDAVERQAPMRDIREIIREAFDVAGNLEGAAQIIGVNPSTLSGWINHNLDGKIRSRVAFAGIDYSLDEPAATEAA